MARPLRIEFAHALYHVTSRGNRRDDIYHDDTDRVAWLGVLAQVCKRFNWTVHAYCMMNNHYHLLVETPDANLSAGMRQLNGVYTQLSNRAHGRVGHVFQGRFKAIVVDKDGYLLELARYIVLNPVRAGTVTDPADWPWSSYRAMLAPGSLPGPEWLATNKLLAYFAPQSQSTNRQQAQADYVQHVLEGVDRPSVWQALTSQMFLGDEKFVKKMHAVMADSPQVTRSGSASHEIPHSQRRPAPLAIESYEQLHAGNRNAAIQAAYATGGYTMARLAVHFKLHYTSVSRIVKMG